MEFERIMTKILKENPVENVFYKTIGVITNNRLNSDTIVRIYQSAEDISYLFDITNRKLLNEVKSTLKIIVKEAQNDEKQIINFLLRKKVVFNNALLAIACFLKFKFILKGKILKNTFKFKFKDETRIFNLYWQVHVKNQKLEDAINITGKMSINKLFIMFKILKFKFFIERIIDRLYDNLEISKFILNNFDYSHSYITRKMLQMSKKEKYKIMNVIENKKKLITHFFVESVDKYLQTNDDSFYYENVIFNGICLEKNETVQEENGSNQAIKMNFTEINDGKQEVFEKVDKEMIKKISYAWLRIFIISDDFILFSSIFENIKPENTQEYKILQSIHTRLIDTVDSRKNGFQKVKINFNETNEFATIKIGTLLKYLKAL